MAIDRSTFLAGLVAVIVPNGRAAQRVTIDPNVPVWWKLRILDGPDFELADHRGKVVVMTFFATWCPPCQMEQPGIVAFANAHPDDTIVVGIDVRERDNEARVWRGRYWIPYRIAMDETGGFQRRIAPAVVFPTTLVFDPGGYLNAWWYGMAGRERFEAARVRALAALQANPDAAEPLPVESPSPDPSPSPG